MKHAHKVAWILFAVLAAMTILFSLLSMAAAYGNPGNDMIAARYTPIEVANGDEDLAAALSARRGTAAAYGLGYGLLLLGMTLAYRRERRFLGWIVAAGLVNAVVILLRVPALGVHYGLFAGTAPLALVVIAAALGCADRRSTAG